MFRRIRTIAIAGLLVLVAASAWYLKCRYIGSVPVQLGVEVEAPSALSRWPWSEAVQERPRRGIKHWKARQEDGTVLDLLCFDFATNPDLRLELYDQDEDDENPFDNHVEFWARGVGQITRDLNRAGRGSVVAAWNGSFCSWKRGGGKDRVGHHVAPVVLEGTAHYNVGNHRWTFGVQYEDGAPRFKAIHLPDRERQEREFAFAAGAVQCLIRNGAPLKLQPFPKPGDKPLPRPAPSTPEEVGHIPDADHMRTSRTSMGWSKDSRQLYLLIVKEPDHEAGSAVAMRRRLPVVGGWHLEDLQRFWQALRVWGAVNIDGGDVTQMVYLRGGDGAYEMVPPRWATTKMRITFSPEFRRAPGGGTLMYFYVREVDD